MQSHMYDEHRVLFAFELAGKHSDIHVDDPLNPFLEFYYFIYESC